MKRRLILAAVAAILLTVCAVTLLIDYRTRPRLVTGPMVQLTTPTGFTLTWEVHPEAPLELQVRRAGSDELATAAAASPEAGRWFAAVDGLEGNTSYDYALVEAGTLRRVVTRGRTRTAPPAGRAFRFLAFGDSGDGRRNQYRVADRLAEFTPDLIIHTGDLVYNRGELRDHPFKFFRPYAQLIASVPFYPCLGNHDFRTAQGQPLLDVFALPRNGPAGERAEREFWFDWGDARFIAFDSNREVEELADVVAPWVESVLSSAGDRWKIVFYHEPVYTHGKHVRAEKIGRTIVPLFDRYGVHLVLNGHNHMYERTWPIREGRLARDGLGTVHVVTGAGGARLYEERQNPPEWIAAWYDASHSFTVVDVAPDVIGLRQVAVDGRVVDDHQIQRKPLVAPLF